MKKNKKKIIKELDYKEFSYTCRTKIRELMLQVMVDIPEDHKKWAIDTFKFHLEGLAAEIGRELAKTGITKVEDE